MKDIAKLEKKIKQLEMEKQEIEETKEGRHIFLGFCFIIVIYFFAIMGASLLLIQPILNNMRFQNTDLLSFLIFGFLIFISFPYQESFWQNYIEADEE